MRLTTLAALPVLACAALAARAQDAPQAPGQAGDDVNPRVEKLLRNLLAQPSCGFRAIGTSPSSDGGDAAKKAPSHAWIEGVQEGDLTFWSRGERSMLANLGPRWVTQDTAGEWLACRSPSNSGFSGQYLPDPRFLAERLLDQLPQVKWEASSETVDERAVRVYRAKLDSAQAAALLRSGALTETPTLAGNSSFAVFQGGAAQRVAVLRAAAGGAAPAAKAADPERRMELTIYEDMATKLPARIKADLWGSHLTVMGGAVQIVAVGGGGFGVAPQKEEDDEETAAKKKDLPNVRVELEIRDAGSASATALDDKARALLGAKPPTAKQ